MNKSYFNTTITKTSVSILWIASLIVFGCTSGPIKSQAIIPEVYDIANKQPYTVSLHIDGGREFSLLKIPQISNETLMDALREAIIQSNLFDEIVEFGEDYKLDLYIFKVSQPIAGSVMTVRVEIGWTLIRRASMDIVWQKSILSSDTSSSDEALNANNRIKLATERAAKKNIREGIRQISQLNLVLGALSTQVENKAKHQSKTATSKPQSNSASKIQVTAIPKIKVNKNEPWTGKWSVEGSRNIGGTWAMKQSGRIVKSTRDSYYEIEGKVVGNQLKAKVVGDYDITNKVVLNISSDGQSFKGTMTSGFNNITIRINGIRK